MWNVGGVRLWTGVQYAPTLQAKGEDMGDILADYREWRDQQPERISTHSDRCHMWHERCMIHRLAAALAKRTPDPSATPGEGTSQARCTLTHAEREAIAAGLGALESLYADAPPISRPIYDRHAPMLRGLLERAHAQLIRETHQN